MFGQLCDIVFTVPKPQLLCMSISIIRCTIVGTFIEGQFSLNLIDHITDCVFVMY